jgi:hypothetical protein
MYLLYVIEMHQKLSALSRRCSSLAPQASGGAPRHGRGSTPLLCHAFNVASILLLCFFVSEQAAAWGRPYACHR